MNKRLVIIAVAVAAAGVAAYVGSRLWAQSGAAPAQAPAQVRVGLINLVHVMANYEKAKLYHAEAKKYQAKLDEFNKALEAAESALKDVKLTPQKRDEWENYRKSVKRALEDYITELKNKVAPDNEKQVINLYKEIEEAVQRYAMSNGFHVVLQYNETINEAEKKNPAYLINKVQRAVGAWACVPMYVANGLDISGAVTDNLNQLYARQGGARPPNLAPPQK